MGTKEQGLTSFASADLGWRGCVIKDGWAWAGADDENGNPLAYMGIVTSLPDTTQVFDAGALNTLRASQSASNPLAYSEGVDYIDGPSLAWRWIYPIMPIDVHGWEGWPTLWELWQPSPNRFVHPVYAAPVTSPMVFQYVDNGQTVAACIMWPGPTPEE